MSATLVTPKTTSGGEIIRELVNSTDGQGLHLSDGGTIVLTNAAGAEFGTSDFSLEFILDQDQDNSSENYIYFSHDSGNSRIRFRHDPGSDAAILTFINSSGAAEDYTLAYDMTGDYGTPTHYALSCDRSGNAVLYKNGDSVASVSIAASSTVDIGASNTSTGNIGYTAGLGAIGTFYRFRTWNKALTAAEVTDTYENATVKFADQWGSQTIVIPGDFTGNLDGWDAYNDWNSQTNPSNNMVLAASAVGQHCRNSATMTDGKRYRCTYTASATTGNPYFAHNRGSVAAITADVGSSTITNGTNSFEFTQTGTGGNGYAYVKAAGATDAVTLDDISIVEIGVVADYDLAFANPTQSRAVQDRAGAADGTSSASGVKQLTPIDGVNTNKLNIGGTTPKLGLGLAAGETPTHEVLIAGASNPAIQICDTDHGVSTSDGLLLQQAGVDSYVWNYETGKLWLGTSNTARLTIDSNGLLTASGASTVDDLNTSAKIYNSAANTCGLQLVDNAGKACIQTSSGSLQIWTDSETQGNNFVAGDLAMTIDSAGKIGVNIVPKAWGTLFDVVQIGYSGALAGRQGDSSNQVDVMNNTYYDGSDFLRINAGYASRFTQNNSGEFEFYNAGTSTAGSTIAFLNRLTIDSAGAVNINNGTVPAGQKLYVRCASDSNLAIGDASGTVKFNALNDANSANVPMEFGVASLSVVGGLATFSNGIAFQSATTSPGGTSNENFTLGAYERGRFTPTILGSSSNPTQSYVTQVGRYEKVGRTVFISGFVELAASGVSAGSGTTRLGGLPFTVSDDTNYYSTIQIGYSATWLTAGAGAPSTGYATRDSTYCNLKVYDNDAGNISGLANADAADAQNNSALMFSGFYYTKES
jgi:hypothetical protein